MKGQSRARNKKRNGLQIWLRRIALSVLGLIIGISIYLINAGTFMRDPLPMPFGIGAANVLSDSMEPAFSRGTLLIVKKEENLKEGDIVVYQSGKNLIVHRIVRLDGNQVVTQGDANNVPDEPFDRKMIKGVAVGKVPYAGTVVGILKTPPGIILLLAAAFFLTEHSLQQERMQDEQELEEIRKEIQRLKQERKKQGD